ncbi:MAG TPA: amino acid racemase, partial [Woeseiaceae bacterium]|nr:amino acid racemase [Woeseiaceae bacterium]
GGMGPAATVDFMTRVMAETPAETDQQHLCMIVDHNPRIPSRQLAMRGLGESPGPTLAAMARRLEIAGADLLVMPCNLAHAWQGDIVAASSVPFISIIDVSVESALARSGDDSAIGLMTTPGCFIAGLYQQAFVDSGRPLILQTADELATTMALVKQIKSGDLSDDVVTGMREQANQLIARGAKVLLAACTEFPLVLDDSMFDVAFVSSTDELARKTVAVALARESSGGQEINNEPGN